MPRFEREGDLAYLSLELLVLILGLQRIALPLLFATRYLLCRRLMPLPFAIVVEIIIKIKPRMFPYLAVVHILIDSGFTVMLFISKMIKR